MEAVGLFDYKIHNFTQINPHLANELSDMAKQNIILRIYLGQLQVAQHNIDVFHTAYAISRAVR